MFPSIAIFDPAGPIALGERSVIIETFLLSTLVIVPVFFMLGYFAWRYRASNEASADAHHPEWDHTSPLAEITWWLVPAAIIAVLSVVAWKSSHALDPYVPLPGNELVVQVVALDWKWLFIYPAQGVASVNELEIPVNTPVHFYLTGDAPINTFWVPQLAGQIMVMPGMTTQLNFEATRTGNFNGLSGNISGKGFSGMTFTVKAVPQEDFDTWVAAIQESHNPLTQDTYAALAAPSTDVPVSYYAPVENGLYTAVAAKYMSATSTHTPDAMGGMQMTP
ncbi:MAG TPA: COX aromatic rich motif-containing protein [Candidatus Paceibacterota bacterium]|nr:COX aromatic rich motif-containing protein [Candidatus Paceibacterota bacterium]